MKNVKKLKNDFLKLHTCIISGLDIYLLFFLLFWLYEQMEHKTHWLIVHICETYYS